MFWRSFNREVVLKNQTGSQEEADRSLREESLSKIQKWETFKKHRAMVIDLYLELKKR